MATSQPTAPGASSPADLLLDREFEYLLNRMHTAGEADNPYLAGYAKHRRALFEYVADLQRRAAAVPQLRDAIELAWGVIANAGGGEWSRETPEWQEAAARWRDQHFHPLMVLNFPPKGERTDLLYEFAGYLSVQESLPPTRGEAYPWQELVQRFLADREASDASR